MTQHLDQGFVLVGRPQGDRAVVVAQVHDGVVRVLTHHVQPARLGADGRHLFAHRHVEVLQETCGTLVKENSGSFLFFCSNKPISETHINTHKQSKAQLRVFFSVYAYLSLHYASKMTS